MLATTRPLWRLATYHPQGVGGLGGDQESDRQVWSREDGYPGDRGIANLCDIGLIWTLIIMSRLCRLLTKEASLE